MIKPFLKWPGGKSDELKIILDSLPNVVQDYYEPFIGGGAVFLGVKACGNYYINDKSTELINLYQDIQNQNDIFLQSIKEINKCWKLLETISESHLPYLSELYLEFSSNNLCEEELSIAIINFICQNANEFNGMLIEDFTIDETHFLIQMQKSLIRKLKRMAKIEQQKGKLSLEDIRVNIETGFKNGLYIHFRYLYNNAIKLNLNKHFFSAIFYFIREYCYSSMFRYNKSGGFNVPYGGSSYNRKNLSNKIALIESNELALKLKNTEVFSEDFEQFFNRFNFNDDDFIFLDPPYDSSFSTYGNNKFTHQDHIRLANTCHNLRAKFMLVIKYTEFIASLYQDFNIMNFDKQYSVSFQNRNNRNTEHLIITNY